MAGRKLTDEQIKELTPDELRGLNNVSVVLVAFTVKKYDVTS